MEGIGARCAEQGVCGCCHSSPNFGGVTGISEGRLGARWALLFHSQQQSKLQYAWRIYWFVTCLFLLVWSLLLLLSFMPVNILIEVIETPRLVNKCLNVIHLFIQNCLWNNIVWQTLWYTFDQCYLLTSFNGDPLHYILSLNKPLLCRL